MSIQNLREERTAKAREYRNTLDNNPGKLSEEVVAKLNELESDITALDERIAREERIVQFAAEEVAAINAARAVSAKPIASEGKNSCVNMPNSPTIRLNRHDHSAMDLYATGD